MVVGFEYFEICIHERLFLLCLFFRVVGVFRVADSLFVIFNSILSKFYEILNFYLPKFFMFRVHTFPGNRSEI